MYPEAAWNLQSDRSTNILKGIVMDPERETALNQIRALLDSERLSVLSTQKGGQPYASLVAFTVTDDLRQIVFMTPSTTRKYDNLTANPKVAMLVNNSRNKPDDITNAVSLTAIGTAIVAEGDHKKRLSALYIDRHPHLKEFVMSPTTACISVEVGYYVMVNHFQNVIEVRMMP